MNAVIELEEAYNFYKNDPAFNRELTELFNEYAGRPSRLYFAEKMTRDFIFSFPFSPNSAMIASDTDIQLKCFIR